MSHEILGNRAVYASQDGIGWHGLGNEIPADIAHDPRKIAALCGAEYTVEKRGLFFTGNDGAMVIADGQEALVRCGIGADKFLCPVSDTRYHIDNRQPIDIFEAFRDELAAQRLTISHAAVMYSGALLAVCAKLPVEYSFEATAGDRVDTYVTLSSGWDKKHGTKAMKTATRVVCANTYGYAESEADKQNTARVIRASTRILNTVELATLLTDARDAVKRERDEIMQLARTPATNADVAAYFAAVLEVDPAELTAIDKATGKRVISTKTQNMLNALAVAYQNAPGADMAHGTVWGALNAVTYYATHEKTCRDTSDSGSDAARVASNLFGDAARLKARAMMLARKFSSQKLLAA